MNRQTYDAVVIGSGIVAASTAFHLCQSGLRVAVVGENPSSDVLLDGFLGVFNSDPQWVMLTLAAQDEFVHWGNIVGGSTGFSRTGIVHLVEKSKRHEIEKALELLRTQNIKHQLLDSGGLRKQFGRMKWSDDEQAVWEPVAGYADPAQCTARYLARVAGSGGLVPEESVAVGLRGRNSKLTGVDTSSGFLDTETAVFAPSSSDMSLIAGLTLPVVTKSVIIQKLLVEGNTDGVPSVWTKAPETMWIRPDGPKHVLVAGVADQASVSDDKRPSDDFLKSCRGRAESRLPKLSITKTVEVHSRVETHTIDGLPVIDQWPLMSGLHFSVALGGTDFKIGPAIGKAIAEWVVSGQKPSLLAPLGVNRFRKWFEEEEKKRARAESRAKKKAPKAASRAPVEDGAVPHQVASAVGESLKESADEQRGLLKTSSGSEKKFVAAPQPALSSSGNQILPGSGKTLLTAPVVSEVPPAAKESAETSVSTGGVVPEEREVALSEAPRRRRRRRRRKRFEGLNDPQASNAEFVEGLSWPLRQNDEIAASPAASVDWPEISVHIPGRDHRSLTVSEGSSLSLRIRPMLSFDLEAMRHLLLEYIDFRNEPRPDKEKIDALLRRLVSDPAAGKIFVAVSGASILGFAILYFSFNTFRAQRLAFLSDLYVKPAERGRGIGRTLCEVCLAFIKDNNFACIQWLAPPEDGPVRALSESFGGRALASMYYSL